jgi:hypothetical protein
MFWNTIDVAWRVTRKDIPPKYGNLDLLCDEVVGRRFCKCLADLLKLLSKKECLNWGRCFEAALLQYIVRGAQAEPVVNVDPENAAFFIALGRAVYEAKRVDRLLSGPKYRCARVWELASFHIVEYHAFLATGSPCGEKAAATSVRPSA